MAGLNHEAVLYDPEALVDPVRIVASLPRLADIDAGDPYTFIECVTGLFPSGGLAVAASPGQTLPLEVPDIYGRPWAKMWQEHFEQGMRNPDRTRTNRCSTSTSPGRREGGDRQ